MLCYLSLGVCPPVREQQLDEEPSINGMDFDFNPPMGHVIGRHGWLASDYVRSQALVHVG